MSDRQIPPPSTSAHFGDGAFHRDDEGDDVAFYSRERLVSHLDATALATVERLVGALVTDEAPAILDLMASWDSHLPEELRPREVVGLGLNAGELEANGALSSVFVHDINRSPRLPFDSESFDAVLCTVSVDYMTRPVEIFAEVGRVLKPGGLFLVVFSNRMFPQKAVRLWKESSEPERVSLVEELFGLSRAFGPTTTFVSRGLPRPMDDKYAASGLPSDPVYAVYAEASGGPASSRPRPRGLGDLEERRSELAPTPDRFARMGETRRCPHCEARLGKYQVPLTPFTEWDTDHLYICFNDECRYFARGWEVMSGQGNVGYSYRFMYNPASGGTGPVPVRTMNDLKDGIVPEPEEAAA